MVIRRTDNNVNNQGGGTAPDVVNPFLAEPGKAAKLKRMRENLFEWSGGTFNEEYWQDLEAGRVDESYWTTP